MVMMVQIGKNVTTMILLFGNAHYAQFTQCLIINANPDHNGDN